MIHQRQNRSILAALLLVCGLTTTTFGQLLSQQIVTSPAPSPTDCTTIDAFIDREAKKLSNSDPSTVAAGRSSFIIQAAVPGATPGFFNCFADSLNKRLVPLAKSPDPRIRLNAAIVAAKVAAKAQNTGLAPVTEELLRDKTEAVALWGLEAAKFVVPQLLIVNSPKATQLGEEVVAEAGNFNSAPVIEEAYRTVLLDPGLGGGTGAGVLKLIPPSALAAFLAEPIALFDIRVKLYAAQLPPQPMADTWAVRFFASQAAWSAAAPAQQTQMKALMLDLAKGAAQQRQVAVDAPTQKALLDVIQQVGFAFQALGDFATPKNSAMKAAGHAVAALGSTVSPQEIDDAIKKLEGVVKL